MSAADGLNFAQFRDKGKAALSAIPPQRAGVLPASTVGLTHHDWMDDNDQAAAAYGDAISRETLPPAKVENVPVGDVHTMQKGVYRGGVHKYLDRKTPTNELPQVSRVGGKNWIDDGHHRYAAFALGGATHIPAMVRDYDA